VAAGGILGVGFYSYNAFPVFAAPALILVALVPVFQRPALTTALKVLLVPAVAALVALPLARFALDSDNDYLDHHRLVAVSEGDEWKGAGFGERARILGGNLDEYVRAVFLEDRPDSVDGTNTSSLLDPLTAVLVLAGVVVVLGSIFRAREPSQRLAGIAVILMVLVIPAGSVLTGDGHARRTLGITPFVAVLAALGLVGTYDLVRARYPDWRPVALAGGALVLSCVVALNLYAYFVTFSRSSTADFVYAADFSDAATWIEDSAPDGAYVYFYSARWSMTYEPMRLIAPDVLGEDRSMEFSPFAEYYRETLGDVTFMNERPGAVVWVLLDGYRQRAADVAALYPQGKLFTGETRDGEPSFYAYTLDATPADNVSGGAP
jgi:hypothetical protein